MHFLFFQCFLFIVLLTTISLNQIAIDGLKTRLIKKFTTVLKKNKMFLTKSGVGTWQEISEQVCRREYGTERHQSYPGKLLLAAMTGTFSIFQIFGSTVDNTCQGSEGNIDWPEGRPPPGTPRSCPACRSRTHAEDKNNLIY